ncbi:uncharacterized protein PITG_13851 [Phytophthora infestans T30-4]|uniref:Uncharacterized protein n=1 Tax=Phytophthora infestans (strain T30-4) TaxID=403677 RepID=D0NMY4_PHYIT|nr:uncharacterized protein PITG_13851 [Phytophthora infestans T30-4]EEY61891.1 hypothetical protein PITG_13851 [Phytophthora infestans T30-4]|eukprot:XP_002899531.1 hypothetical protein PITG_13851 [Phytophthora infestans T30-4]
MAPSTHGKFKRAHCQPTITKNAIQEDGKHPNFRLKTLEEHRHATRFQKKHVTLKTWRPALCEAHILIKSGDRVSLAKALYLLLEIIWIDPRGCNLATVYLDAGSIYLEFDHLQEATKAYRNCLRLDGANWKARYNLGVATARLQDFIEATRQLTLAFKASPADIADEIAKMLKEIEHIQYSKNLQAYKEATKARVFTTQFLESRHLVGGKLGVSNLQEDHTVSHRNGLSLSSSTPQLLDTSNKWQGVLASVLHRLHAFARCRDIDIQYEMLRLDPKWTSGVSIETLNELTKQITGTSLSVAERNVMLGNYGTTTFHYFSPNAESCHAFDEIHDQGACHALLHWNLCRKRAKRSATSKTGGLWYWFELTMAKWVERVLPPSSLDHTTSSLVETLSAYGWITPMDFAWKWRRLPEPQDVPMLQLANRGIFIYECHVARTCIHEEASKTLQMFLRRFITRRKRCQLVRDTVFDQQVAREVLVCIEDMVDEVITKHRLQQKKYEEEIQRQEVPVRTEQRQKIINERCTGHRT